MNLYLNGLKVFFNGCKWGDREDNIILYKIYIKTKIYFNPFYM